MFRKSIGILAGYGQFPKIVAEGIRAQGYRVIVCGFYDQTDASLFSDADVFEQFHLGQFRKVLKFFQDHGVEEVCMAGGINKPRALSFRPDLMAAKMLFSMKGKGDDALLRAIIGLFEENGIKVVSSSCFAQRLPCPAGQLSKRAPTDEEWDSIRYAWPIAESLGRFDIGQCLVVKQNMVVAVECLEGTDAALKRGAELGGDGCIAVKRFKPGQDERADLPSVGLETIRLLGRLHYTCLAIEADKTLFFDREEAIRLADRLKLAVVALKS
ncbi:MAG: UDP-2,3-diacylglucosamine diphosphatase LpxI [Desulfovibrionaceae bacterium]|nr:UDP-2,3-diacylglucosamine diphosphatase LpxI [Desulfovibrionaceae bacterium]